MNKDLTTGNVTKTMLIFAGPMIAGNLLQQFYNIADTLIVGKFLGAEAMAAVGTAYTLMSFLTSILIGLCMGSGSVFSFYYGKKDILKMQDCIRAAFFMIGGITIVVNILSFLLTDQILRLLRIPKELMAMMRLYVLIIFAGIFFVFLYNYFSYFLRALGNSVIPLYFLGGTSLLNVALDLLFVLGFGWGIGGAAAATVISQAISGVGIGIYAWVKEPWLRDALSPGKWKKKLLAENNGHVSTKESIKEIARFSFAASIQQSVMNFGILVVQGLVNSFGVAVMAAFTAAVKIDSFAYMPAQEFGNAFSLFVSQNFGAGKEDRVKKGVKHALGISMIFCLFISVLVFGFAKYLMLLFVSPSETEIINIGVGYLRVEGAFYCGIGILFLLYAFYRGINRPEMSLILTVISLGTRVLLAYVLSPVPAIGVMGIWWAIPIGWFLADMTGIIYMAVRVRKTVFAPVVTPPDR